MGTTSETTGTHTHADRRAERLKHGRWFRRSSGHHRGGEGDRDGEEGRVRGEDREDLRDLRARVLREASGGRDKLQGQGESGRDGLHSRPRVLPPAAHGRGPPARERGGGKEGRGQDRVIDRPRPTPAPRARARARKRASETLVLLLAIFYSLINS